MTGNVRRATPLTLMYRGGPTERSGRSWYFSRNTTSIGAAGTSREIRPSIGEQMPKESAAPDSAQKQLFGTFKSPSSRFVYLLREELGDGHLSLHAGPAVGLAVVPVVALGVELHGE